MTYAQYRLHRYFQKLWNTSSLIGLCHRSDTSLTGSNSDHSLAYLQLMLYYLSFTISIKTTDELDQCVRVLLLDFSKAFDKIDHHILIRKMEEMAIDPVHI